MDHSSSQAEKRARLRRAKILTNSEDRMNRIFGVQSSQSSSTTNDIPRDLPPPSSSSSSNTFDAHRSECSSSRQHIILPNHSEQSLSTATTIDSIVNQPQHGCLPPRDESFPRKVSLISSPIHYKTLQQSQRFQQQQNSILSKIFIWPSLYLMNLKLLLFTISCIGSYYGLNFTALFFTFESINFVFNWLMNYYNNGQYNDNGQCQNRNSNINNNNNNNIRFTFGQFSEDFFLSIFCYIIIQAILIINR